MCPRERGHGIRFLLAGLLGHNAGETPAIPGGHGPRYVDRVTPAVRRQLFDEIGDIKNPVFGQICSTTAVEKEYLEGSHRNW